MSSKSSPVVSPYYTPLNRPPKVRVDCSGVPSQTQQSFKAECDINNIMAKYRQSGLLQVSKNYEAGRYADLAHVDDYHAAMNKVVAAREAFDALPSDLRERFLNDPARFLAFLGDPKNTDEAIRLGLATARIDAKAENPVTGEPSTGGAVQPPKAEPSPPVGGSGASGGASRGAG